MSQPRRQPPAGLEDIPGKSKCQDRNRVRAGGLLVRPYFLFLSLFSFASVHVDRQCSGIENRACQRVVS